MTPKERAAMQQALGALELAIGSHGVMLTSYPPHDAWQYRRCDFKLAEAITALREALAEQAEQEPVAYKPYKVTVPSFMQHRSWHSDEIQRWLDELPPLYVGPVRTKDLTDDEIADIVYEMNGNEPTAPFWRDLARAVIAADREKNK